MRKLVTVVAAVALMSGCATYQREKADLVAGGGQSQRLTAAQERLDNAQAEQLSLREEQVMASEELAAVQDELAAANSNRRVRERQLQQAKADAKISDSQVAELQGKLQRQTEDFNDAALGLEASRAGGSSAEVKRREEELRKLKQELARTNEEIEIMSN